MKLLGMGLVWTGFAATLFGGAATVRISNGWICAGIIVASVLLLTAGAAVMLRMEREEERKERKKK